MITIFFMLMIQWLYIQINPIMEIYAAEILSCEDYVSVDLVDLEDKDETETELFMETMGDTVAGIEISAPAAILIEASTGTVIYEKNADEMRAPASVTKIMTLLLIFDALEAGEITLDEIVTVSSYAASMGGSQIYLEVGETQTVETMIKAIVISSANDACVAMAEHISGSAELFVSEMNERAKGLGMENTNFMNCNGLDTQGHVTTARDIALMSQELMNRYPEIQEYTTIWMEDITHVTSQGSSVFTLSSTNKLLTQYAYTTGLKTGSTDDALFCISATAQKDGIEMIAVIMGAETSALRNEDAITLLDYGFGVTEKYEETERGFFDDISVAKGIVEYVQGQEESLFVYIDTEGNNLEEIQTQVIYKDGLEAPISEGEVIGEIIYTLHQEEIGHHNIVAVESVIKMNFKYALLELIQKFLL